MQALPSILDAYQHDDYTNVPEQNNNDMANNLNLYNDGFALDNNTIRQSPPDNIILWFVNSFILLTLLVSLSWCVFCGGKDVINRWASESGQEYTRMSRRQGKDDKEVDLPELHRKKLKRSFEKNAVIMIVEDNDLIPENAGDKIEKENIKNIKQSDKQQLKVCIIEDLKVLPITCSPSLTSSSIPDRDLEAAAPESSSPIIQVCRTEPGENYSIRENVDDIDKESNGNEKQENGDNKCKLHAVEDLEVVSTCSSSSTNDVDLEAAVSSSIAAENSLFSPVEEVFSLDHPSGYLILRGSQKSGGVRKNNTNTNSIDNAKNSDENNTTNDKAVLEDRRINNCCAICLMPYDVGEKVVWSSNPFCVHAFHEECILEWLVKMKDAGSTPCPCCRQPFTDLEESDESKKKRRRRRLPPANIFDVNLIRF